MNDPRVVTAARIGEVFQIDPIVVLKATTPVWWLRVACYKVIANDRRRQAEEAKRGR